ncbi:recombinase family protein [Blautia sp. Marseille-P3201T]|mgnify:FL=1|uniref:recombinase family protein n=1 Tax=Blautia sp. Marseille-P3201T TaxID=1907659 RepID=UPI000A4EBF8F
MSGMIDIVMTKSISRFSRNLVDTLQYVRMLKERGVTIIFEKENINTSTMESEMQLAQNEVESLSQNVKMGVKMKMRRGEMMGFNGCLGYDYHPENKSITVNEAEAETVRYIFDRYIEGYGAYTIAKELTALGKVNKKGQIKWTDSGVRGIIKNEKYKGDLLQGKTYTVDPISKRRLDNRGEEDRFYIKDHHEAIVSKEIWDRAQEICQGRYKKNANVVDGTRTKFTRKFALSSMCQCGFCGTNLTRRSHNQDTHHMKTSLEMQNSNEQRD